MEIKLMQRDEIDDKRWNGCVHFAINALPYGYTWYLDNICEEWLGLVIGKYKVVMPLVKGSKFGFDYIYQPFFAQQLGVFTDTIISKELQQEMLASIPESFSYIDMNVNTSNPHPEGFEVEKRDNYLLDLSASYEQIQGKYSGNLKRKLVRARKNELKYKNQLKPEVFVDFYMQHTAPKVPGFEERHKHSMLRIIYKAMYHNMGGLVGVYKEDELIAANFLLFHPQRTINLFPTSSKKGNELNAMPFLMDTVINIGAGNRKYLDFEGSMLEGVAQFYRSFGAELHHYFRIKRNNLPWYAKIFKK